MQDPQHVIILYTNWQGKTGHRTIAPLEVYWGNTEYHPEDQWLLEAWDVEKEAFRTFAMKDVQSWTPA